MPVEPTLIRQQRTDQQGAADGRDRNLGGEPACPLGSIFLMKLRRGR
jgi:hypothetical protein